MNGEINDALMASTKPPLRIAMVFRGDSARLLLNGETYDAKVMRP